MKNLKTYEKFNQDELLNEEIIGFVSLGTIPILIFLLWLNTRYAKFGTGNKSGGGWSRSWQNYPFKGLFKYIKMSKILKKYKKEIDAIDSNILERNPEIKQCLYDLKEKGDVNFIDMTAVSLYYDSFIREVIKTLKNEEKIIVKKILIEFRKEMDTLFGEDITRHFQMAVGLKSDEEIAADKACGRHSTRVRYDDPLHNDVDINLPPDRG